MSEYMDSNDDDSSSSVMDQNDFYQDNASPYIMPSNEFRKRRSTESSSTVMSDDEHHSTRRNSVYSVGPYYSPPPVMSDSENLIPTSTGEESDHSPTRKNDSIDKKYSMSRSYSESSNENYNPRESVESCSDSSNKLCFYQSAGQSSASSSMTPSSTSIKRSYSNESSSSDSDDDRKRQRLDSTSSDQTNDKSSKIESKTYSSAAERMMRKMGYQQGRGLGKLGQGIVEPIKAVKQEGKRGLGLKIPHLDIDTYEWNASEEVIELQESYSWMSGDLLPPLTKEDMKSWMKEGKKKLSIDKETHFCNPELLKNILQCKTVFDHMESDKFFVARNKSNPFEHIRKGPFINRAAMKMANMDTRFDYMFTQPKYEDGKPMLHSNELLYFADVCAGPGGFSEYVLYRKKWMSKGFGFTLVGNNDFRLEDFRTGPSETFEPFYGVAGDGDVYNPENIKSFYDLVMDSTQGKGVHFMMADGGFSVEGQENIQEILSKRLYLCQFLVSLFVVRTHGHFVCKVFDMFTPFSAGLLYLMYRSYKQVCIFKPNTSRPANSERYIICKWKRNDCSDVRDYMFQINLALDQMSTLSDKDVVSVVPHEVMVNDKEFFDYLVTSNNVLGERQVVNLAKIKAFYQDPMLIESKQAELKKESYSLWKVPFTNFSKDDSPTELFSSICDNNTEWKNDLLNPKQFIKSEQDIKHFNYIYNWHFVMVGFDFDSIRKHGDKPTLFLGLGKFKVFKYNSDSNNWVNDNSLNIQLSPGTLVLGEVVEEREGEGGAQLKKKAFHIIDAYQLGHENISSLHFTERRKKCELFVESLRQRSNSKMNRIRMKHIFHLHNVDRDLSCIMLKKLKNGKPQLSLDMGGGTFAPVTGIFFINGMREGWIRSFSRSNKKFFFDKQGGPSTFDMIPEACARFQDCVRTKKIWRLESGCGILNEPRDGERFYKKDLVDYVKSKLIR